MKTLQQIDEEIAQLRSQLSSLKGTECEVYTRIVGYYRSLRNWNKGKKEEYRLRETFSPPVNTSGKDRKANEVGEEVASKKQGAIEQIEVSEYRYFFRKTCPQCPPVKEYVSNLPLEGKQVDVDTEEGLSEAQQFQVLSTPTVIFLDRDGRPIHAAHTVDQLEDMRPHLFLSKE